MALKARPAKRFTSSFLSLRALLPVNKNRRPSSSIRLVLVLPSASWWLYSILISPIPLSVTNDINRKKLFSTNSSRKIFWTSINKWTGIMNKDFRNLSKRSLMNFSSAESWPMGFQGFNAHPASMKNLWPLVVKEGGFVPVAEPEEWLKVPPIWLMKFFLKNP